MAFLYNGNEPKTITYNTNNVAKLIYNGHDVWYQKIYYTLTGQPPLTMTKSLGEPLDDYIIYGNLLRDGTPTIDNPVDIQQVGDLVTDSQDENYGKYKIPVTATVNNDIITTNIYLTEPLRKTGLGLDYIDFKNKLVHREIKEVIFSGAENWSKTSGSSNIPYFRQRVGDANLVDQINSTNQYCNYIIFGSPTTGNTNTGASVYQSSSNTYFRIRFDGQPTTSDEMEQFVKELYDNGNPLRIVFKIKTPEEESIDLPEILTMKGTNIISVGTTLQPSDMSINYYGSKY